MSDRDDLRAREQAQRISDCRELEAASQSLDAEQGEADQTVSYCVKIVPHYSGLISAHFPDFPGLVVLGRDHEEAKDLALAALEQELERLIREDRRIPRPDARGRLTITIRKTG